MAKKSSEKDSALHSGEPPEAARYGGLRRVRVHMTHTTPLLLNAMSEEQLLGIRERTKAPKTAAKPTPREEADSKVYRLADGRPHLPVKNLYACFISAGVFVRMDGKRQWSSAKSSNVPGALSIEDVELPLYLPGGEAGADSGPAGNGVGWEVDIQQGRNPNGGEAVCIVRPRFDLWELRCTLEIDTQQMPPNVARELVDIAGRRIGLGDFRPQRKGTFGRFVVTLWQAAEGRLAA